MELLYADDLVLMAESEESLHVKTVQWKSRLKAKDLKWKTKALFNCSRKDRWKRVLTRSSADADNGLDAFSGQSRSANMVPFWIHCDFSLSM